MTPAEIKSVAARRAFATGLSPAEREAEAARIEAELTAEAAAAEKARAAAAVEAEAAQERQRIGAVVKIGADLGRPRQAARLAISSPLDAIGAKSVLATLPPDMHAGPEALAITSEVGTFGTAGAQAERRRIGAILGHPEAADRFATASAIALDTGLDVAQALAALLAAPRQAAKRYPSLEQRSREAGEFGALAGGADHMTRSQRVDAIWSKAVKEANASIGAVPAPVAATTPPNPSMMTGGLDLPGAEAALSDLAKG